MKALNNSLSPKTQAARSGEAVGVMHLHGRTKEAFAANRSKKKRSESRAESTADEQIREILPECR